ncbi:MAG: bifunctional demethylmenaquinone methyltransferase/2-methoxy-6-polyprenyl-1,4-benzoquinol methylase UbiE [Phycisphaerales bacterium]
MSIDKLFDGIAGRYDLFNRVSSLGLDKSWRRKLSASLKSQRHLKILDVAVGTGDILLSLYSGGCDISFAAGIDPSENMLAIAERKLKSRSVEFKQATAEQIPYPENYFDAATCAFGVRNFADADKGLQEMFRVLKPGGQILILEFSRPANPFVRFIYSIYLNYYIPLLGKILTGQYAAYKYLSRTIQSFPSGNDFCMIIQKAGFADVKHEPLSFGIVGLYTAKKQAN